MTRQLGKREPALRRRAHRRLRIRPEDGQRQGRPKITWEHQDASASHTVTALDGTFRSGQLEQGDEFSHVFRRAGTFVYRCSVHPAMRGTVKVGG